MTIEIKPDWSKAPEWAKYWAVDINGTAFWYREEPEMELNDEGKPYGVWASKDMVVEEDEEWVDKWKDTLQERPILVKFPELKQNQSTLGEFKEIFTAGIESKLDTLISLMTMVSQDLDKLTQPISVADFEPSMLP